MKQTLRVGLGLALFAITGMSATALAANRSQTWSSCWLTRREPLTAC